MNAQAAVPQPSAWSPFGHPAFAVLWVATVLSNVGTWMHDVASGWLMTSLSPSPLMVALVQAATTAPIFLFALPAGALADLLDRRRLLVAVMALLALLALALGLLAMQGRVDPWTLIAFTFVSGVGAAFAAPAWQAIVPQLVPRPNLPQAVALNSVGINVSRAIGPALAGLIIASFGIAWPYLLNTLSFLVVIAALLWWRPPAPPPSHLPAERFLSAIRVGLRHARASGPLRATLLRAVAFFLFASAYWALLPLIVRRELGGGPELYGLMLGAMGLGAVLGAVLLPWLKDKLGVDRLVAAGTAGMALVLAVLALVKLPAAALLASLLAGVSWIAVLSSLNVSAQLALPDWVRARGLSIFITVFFGSMTLGSLAWGQLATQLGIQAALLLAAAGALLGIALTRHARLAAGTGLDLRPSAHWPEPVVARMVEPDRGPVMVTVAYRIEPGTAPAFQAAMAELAQERRRNGAYGWGLFEDAAAPGRYLESFIEESWLAHLRHHDRVTETDRALQARIRDLQIDSREPVVTHFLPPAEAGTGSVA